MLFYLHVVFEQSCKENLYYYISFLMKLVHSCNNNDKIIKIHREKSEKQKTLYVYDILCKNILYGKSNNLMWLAPVKPESLLFK